MLISENSGIRENFPYTDPEEVRKTITVRFEGTPKGTIIVHMFLDGTIKTPDEFCEEKNRREAEVQELRIQEALYPNLEQTPVREKAYVSDIQPLTIPSGC